MITDPWIEFAMLGADAVRALDAFRREGVEKERKRCVAILHDEGWLGRSEQRIAHPKDFDEDQPHSYQTRLP